MAQIIVAFDIGEESERLLQRASGAWTQGDQVVLVYVVPAAGALGFVDTGMSSARAQEHVNAGIDALRKAGIEAIGVVREGEPAREIIELARELNARMVVVGAKGEGMSGRMRLGAVASEVLESCPRPVLVVK